MAQMTDNRSNASQLSENGDDKAQALNTALDTGDMNRIMTTLTDMARVRGISRVAQETGLGRESLYKSMRPTSSPSFATVLKVMRSLGLGVRTFPRLGELGDIVSRERNNRNGEKE